MPTQAQVNRNIASKTGLTGAQVSAVFVALTQEIQAALQAGDTIKVAGLINLTRTRQAARPARMGRNPRTGEAIQISAKPAKNVVKVRALKGLKEMV